MVTFSMTLTDLNPIFKIAAFSEVEYIKNGAFYGQNYYRTLIGNHTRRRMVPLSNDTTFNDPD